MIGTLINVAAVAIGSLIGLAIHSRLPQRLIKTVFQAIGLFTLFLGIAMALKAQEMLLIIFALVFGALVGEGVGLDNLLDRYADKLKTKLRFKNEKFSEGLISAFLLFCMGSMTILGAFEEGLGGKPNLLLAKSVLDGFAAIALASTLGAGVLFSIIPLLLYQGGLTLFAAYLGNVLNQAVINEITGVGGILLVGLGISILEIKKLKMLNMTPALFFIVGLYFLQQWLSPFLNVL